MQIPFRNTTGMTWLLGRLQEKTGADCEMGDPYKEGDWGQSILLGFAETSGQTWQARSSSSSNRLPSRKWVLYHQQQCDYARTGLGGVKVIQRYHFGARPNISDCDCMQSADSFPIYIRYLFPPAPWHRVHLTESSLRRCHGNEAQHLLFKKYFDSVCVLGAEPNMSKAGSIAVTPGISIFLQAMFTLSCLF